MAVGSGLGASLGFVKEGTWGTYATPTKFLPAKSFVISRDAQRQQGTGLRNGRHGPLAAHYVETTQAAKGTVTLDAQTNLMGQLYEALMGASTATNLSGSAYQQVFTLGDPTGKGLTLQGGVPYRGGTVRPHTLTGGKVTSVEFSCEVGGLLAVTVNVDGKQWTDGHTLATPSYVSTAPFHGGQLTAKIGTFGGEASVAGVRSYSVTIERGMDVGDYTAGNSGLKSEPVLNDYTKISGTLTVDWVDKTTFQDRANGTAATSLVLEHVGAVITGTYTQLHRLTIPSIVFDPNTQNVDGLGELTTSWAFNWVDDGTNSPTLTYVTTDTSI